MQPYASLFWSSQVFYQVKSTSVTWVKVGALYITKFCFSKVLFLHEYGVLNLIAHFIHVVSFVGTKPWYQCQSSYSTAYDAVNTHLKLLLLLNYTCHAPTSLLITSNNYGILFQYPEKSPATFVGRYNKKAFISA